jgi:hypothetical protein
MGQLNLHIPYELTRDAGQPVPVNYGLARLNHVAIADRVNACVEVCAVDGKMAVSDEPTATQNGEFLTGADYAS